MNINDIASSQWNNYETHTSHSIFHVRSNFATLCTRFCGPDNFAPLQSFTIGAEHGRVEFRTLSPAQRRQTKQTRELVAIRRWTAPSAHSFKNFMHRAIGLVDRSVAGFFERCSASRLNSRVLELAFRRFSYLRLKVGTDRNQEASRAHVNSGLRTVEAYDQDFRLRDTKRISRPCISDTGRGCANHASRSTSTLRQQY